jgi:hypothetical protein
MKKQERDEARKKWRREQELRALREAELRKLEKLDLTDAEFKERLEDMGLWLAPRLPPAMEFIKKHVNKNLDNWQQVIIDLVASDTPLDPKSRSLLAGELRSLYFPNPAKDHRFKRQAEAELLEREKRFLTERGMTAIEAEKEVAKSFKLTVAGLRKKIQRATRASGKIKIMKSDRVRNPHCIDCGLTQTLSTKAT